MIFVALSTAERRSRHCNTKSVRLDASPTVTRCYCVETLYLGNDRRQAHITTVLADGLSIRLT